MSVDALPGWPRLIAGPGDDDDDDEAPIGDPPDDDEDSDDEDDDDEEPLQMAFLHRSIATGAASRHNVAPNKGRKRCPGARHVASHALTTVN